MMKKYIQKKLENYVVRYFAAHPDVQLIVIAGSVGKTSTKRAIGTLLSQKYRVQLHEGNHNTHLSAPLAILGIEYPENVRSLLAWLKVFRAARRRIARPSQVDVIVQEIGTDRVGDIAHFGTYLRPAVSVITAVSAEHMEYFETLDAVAKEELTAANFAELAVINRDDIDAKYVSFLTNATITTYGTSVEAEYHYEIRDFAMERGYYGMVVGPAPMQPVAASIKLIGEHSIRAAMAAVAVADKLGLTSAQIVEGLKLLRAVPGRMNLLRGIDDTIIIDDTYNSSPIAANSALRELYKIAAPQRIAILGSMNELGTTSDDEHRKLGEMCDPTLLAWVVTVGDEAEKFLAPAARARGCQVKSFHSAIDAGAFVRGISESGAVILAKGSQGDIYVEEAVKVLCLLGEDDELVRQSRQWMATKEAFFSKFA